MNNPRKGRRKIKLFKQCFSKPFFFLNKKYSKARKHNRNGNYNPDPIVLFSKALGTFIPYTSNQGWNHQDNRNRSHLLHNRIHIIRNHRAYHPLFR
jgi:hypothetical protein